MATYTWFEEKPENRILIGAFVTSWSNCEQAMFEQVCWARGVPVVAETDFAWPIQINTKRLIRQWRRVSALLFERYGIDYIDLGDLASQLKNLSEWRNLIVHGFYDDNTHTGQSTVTLLRWDDGLGTLVEEPFIITTETLQALHEKASELFHEVAGCDEAVIAATKNLRATNPKAAKPERPEILRLTPKPIPI